MLKKEIYGSTVRRSTRHKITLPALCIGLVCVLASRFIITAHAGLRGPGKYSGVIVFDRWVLVCC